MKRAGTTLICLLCISALTPTIRAVVKDSAPGGDQNSTAGTGPYSAIWLRNVFDLQPPKVIVTAPVTPPTPPPNIKLTGITTIFGMKQALFLVQSAAAPGKPPGKDESYMLAEGERRGSLEVVSINPITKLVKIKNDGAESDITFEVNKGPTGGGPTTAQAAPPQPPGPGGAPLQRSFGRNPGNPGMPIPIPNRTIRPSDGQGYQGANSQMAPQGNSGQQYPGFSGSGMQSGYAQSATPANAGLNLGGMFNQPQSAPQQQQTQQPALPAEQQVLNGLLQQTQHADEVKAGVFPPMPPIPGLEMDK